MWLLCSLIYVKSKVGSQLLLIFSNSNARPGRGSEKAFNERVGVSIAFLWIAWVNPWLLLIYFSKFQLTSSSHWELEKFAAFGPRFERVDGCCLQRKGHGLTPAPGSKHKKREKKRSSLNSSSIWYPICEKKLLALYCTLNQLGWDIIDLLVREILTNLRRFIN